MSKRWGSRPEITSPGAIERWLLHRRFHDFDELCESVKSWDLDWRQLDKGPLVAEILQLGVGAVQLDRSTFGRQFEQRGSSPREARTLGFIEEQVQGTIWCGSELDDNNLSVFHPGGEFDALSRPGFTCYTLSFPEEHLAALGETLGIQDFDRVLGNISWIAACDPHDMNDLRMGLRMLFEEVIRLPSAIESPGLVREIEFEIPARILSVLASSRGGRDPRTPRWNVRKIAVERALAFIEQNHFEPITVQELCRATRVSWRTLDYAFRDKFGVSPKNYLKAIRLNKVRRALVRATPDEKVSQVASEWGFWHMGQFASDYREMFGELPSETLKRSLTASRNNRQEE